MFEAILQKTKKSFSCLSMMNEHDMQRDGSSCTRTHCLYHDIESETHTFQNLKSSWIPPIQLSVGQFRILLEDMKILQLALRNSVG